MPYKRDQQMFRRYPYFNAMPRPFEPVLDDTSDSLGDFREAMEEASSIPLPNEVELPTERPTDERRSLRIPDIFDFLRKHIQLEDIIIIGLILILIAEGVEDELLLLILVYLLLG